MIGGRDQGEAGGGIRGFQGSRVISSLVSIFFLLF